MTVASVGQQKTGKWVLVWVGRATGLLEQAAENAVQKIKNKGYSTKKVGRTWDELRAYQTHECLYALLAVAHGACWVNNPYCVMDVVGVARFWEQEPHGGEYAVVKPGEVVKDQPNDWRELHSTSRAVFKRLSVIHCMDPRVAKLMLNEGKGADEVFTEIKQWYAVRLGVFPGAVHLCPAGDRDPGGCANTEAIKGIDEFVAAL
jgi:hypothetical protein